jgi:hypothetical protein
VGSHASDTPLYHDLGLLEGSLVYRPDTALICLKGLTVSEANSETKQDRRNVMVRWVVLLLRFRESLHSNVGSKTGYPT